jgi:hypothetical protein
VGSQREDELKGVGDPAGQREVPSATGAVADGAGGAGQSPMVQVSSGKYSSNKRTC